MKISSFTTPRISAGLAASILLPVSAVFGQTTVATAPVGYLQTSCLSNSDTLVAPPFTRPAAFTGSVASIAGNVITVSGTLTASAYNAPTTTPPTADSYYLSIGPATATLTGTVSVTSGSQTVTGSGTSFGAAGSIVVGDRLTINDGANLLTYTVTAIASTTSLTIDRAYSDTAATGTNSASVAPVSVTALKLPTHSLLTTNVAKTSVGTAVLATNGTTLAGLAATYDHSPYEGRFYAVTANTATAVTVNLNNDSLSSVATGTQISIIPYWTLNSVFNTPPSNPTVSQNVSFTPTSTSHQPQTQIYIPNYAPAGINQSATAEYFFYNNGTSIGWRSATDLVTDQGFVPLLPDGYFTVRNPSTSPALPITFSGAVPVNKLVTVLDTSSSLYLDNAVALNRPATATLNSLGLGPSDSSFTATTTTHSPQDQLYVYDNTQPVINKSASQVYVYFNSATQTGWRTITDPTTDHGGDLIPPGSALILRKAPTANGQTAFWTNAPNY